MSHIPERLWESEFPDIPMPHNCTYEQFSAACRHKTREDRKDTVYDQVKAYIALKRLTDNQIKRDILDELIKSEMENLIR